jgi:hypothetical protein
VTQIEQGKCCLDGQHNQKCRKVADIEQKKTGRIAGRISGDLRMRLDRITERFGAIDATMLEDSLTALADFVERLGRYERPMRMVLEGEAARLPLAAEAPGAYKAAAKRKADALTRELDEAQRAKDSQRNRPSHTERV